MQTQSRLIANTNGGAATGFDSAAAVDEHQYCEAVVRELARGHELTGELQAEVLRVLRGQGQAEATAALILREVSRAFTVCISIMGGSSAPAATAPAVATLAAAAGAGAGARRAKVDGVPRQRIMTASPYSDGHQWRKYGQKRIIRTSFPRCYFRCCHHRARGCPATKQVQEQPSDGGPRMFLVLYVHEHTCHNTSPAAAAEPAEVAARSPKDLLGFSAGGLPPQQQPGGVLQLSKEELEQQAFVSSLACVLQGSQCYSGGGSPEGSSSRGRPGGEDGGASAPAVSFETSAELPASLGDDEGLDVMDYEVTDSLFFGATSSYGRDE